MGIRLNLGCFSQVYDGWVNTDITPNIFIARIAGAAWALHAIGVMSDEHFSLHQLGVFKKVRYLNVARRFRYADHSVECAFCSHILEHLYPRDAAKMFSEVLRILKPGGVFRVVVPDLEWALRLYNRKDPAAFLNAMYEYSGGIGKNSHKWMFTDLSLKQFFESQGFIDVKVCGFQEGRLPNVEQMDCRPANSVFVEGICPLRGIKAGVV